MNNICFKNNFVFNCLGIITVYFIVAPNNNHLTTPLKNNFEDAPKIERANFQGFEQPHSIIKLKNTIGHSKSPFGDKRKLRFGSTKTLRTLKSHKKSVKIPSDEEVPKSYTFGKEKPEGMAKEFLTM